MLEKLYKNAKRNTESCNKNTLIQKDTQMDKHHSSLAEVWNAWENA